MRPPGLITYDYKKTIARMSQKFGRWSTLSQIIAINLKKKLQYDL